MFQMMMMMRDGWVFMLKFRAVKHLYFKISMCKCWNKMNGVIFFGQNVNCICIYWPPRFNPVLSFWAILNMFCLGCLYLPLVYVFNYFAVTHYPSAASRIPSRWWSHSHLWKRMISARGLHPSCKLSFCLLTGGHLSIWTLESTLISVIIKLSVVGNSCELQESVFFAFYRRLKTTRLDHSVCLRR